MGSCISVAGDEQFVGGELGGAVEVDRVAGLVGGKGDHALDAAIDAGVDEVHGAVDVGLDAFEWVVLGRGHDLSGGGMHHVVDAVERTGQPGLVAHVTDDEADPGIAGKFLGHVPLLHFVAGKDDQTLRVVLL